MFLSGEMELKIIGLDTMRGNTMRTMNAKYEDAVPMKETIMILFSGKENLK